MSTRRRFPRQHLLTLATVVTVAWLGGVYNYAISGRPAAAGHVGSKTLVTTAFGSGTPNEPLERRSKPVRIDVRPAEPVPSKRARPDKRSPRRPPKRPRKAPSHDLPYSLPVERGLTTSELKEPHHDYPAVDLALPTGTKVVASTSGRITATTRWGACGKGVILEDQNDFTYTYCHGSKLLVGRGRFVHEGRGIMRSGNTGDSTGPHLHLQIRRPNGNLICPQHLLTAWAKGKPKQPSAAGRRGCFTGGGHHKHRGKRR